MSTAPNWRNAQWLMAVPELHQSLVDTAAELRTLQRLVPDQFTRDHLASIIAGIDATLHMVREGQS